jgi:hypothetical protein
MQQAYTKGKLPICIFRRVLYSPSKSLRTGTPRTNGPGLLQETAPLCAVFHSKT